MAAIAADEISSSSVRSSVSEDGRPTLQEPRIKVKDLGLSSQRTSVSLSVYDDFESEADAQFKMRLKRNTHSIPVTTLMTGLTSQQLGSISQRLVANEFDQSAKLETPDPMTTTSDKSRSGLRHSGIAEVRSEEGLVSRLRAEEAGTYSPKLASSPRTQILTGSKTTHHAAPDDSKSSLSVPELVPSSRLVLQHTPTMFHPLATITANEFEDLANEVKYRTSCPQLPASTPAEHPHIIEPSSLQPLIPQRRAGFADLAVTILYEWNPRVMVQFLDLRRKTFRYTWTRKSESTVTVPRESNHGNDECINHERASLDALTIERKVKFVTVSIKYSAIFSHDLSHAAPTTDVSPQTLSFHETLARRRKHGFLKTNLFSIRRRKQDTLSQIEESITYRIVHESTGGWVPVSINGPRRMSIIGPRNIDQYVRRSFARSILEAKVWEADQTEQKMVVRGNGNGTVKIKSK